LGYIYIYTKQLEKRTTFSFDCGLNLQHIERFNLPEVKEILLVKQGVELL